MARIDTAFLLLASACLIIGVCLGIYMGVNEDLQLVAVHTHINPQGAFIVRGWEVAFQRADEIIDCEDRPRAILGPAPTGREIAFLTSGDGTVRGRHRN